MGSSWVGDQNKYDQQGQPDTDYQVALQSQGKENQAGSESITLGSGMQPVIDIRQPQQAKCADKKEKEPSHQGNNGQEINDQSEPGYNQSRAPFSRYLAIPIVVIKLIKA